ncbi:MAG: CPBP family intramembrane metalloprotease [Clostridia bacterium]|nr:CPBP family intramembrane metalloprotease [Clostridia bacterium]MBR2927380.1 CPBP family intramembrane metalloprotease [Clostridia bacterium]
MKQRIYILLSVLSGAFVMSMVDGVWQPSYLVKSLIKILIFSSLPLIYFLSSRKRREEARALFVPSKKSLLYSALLGILVFGVIMGAYALLKNQIDFSSIASNLTSGAGVTAENFIWVAIYISIVNSLLEEFFFRGFAFAALRNAWSRPMAYLFSATTFSLYHLGMTAGWFHPGIWLLSLVGLFLGGCIFNYLNEKSNSLYASWLTHLCANLAINTIGCILFGIL